MHIFLLIDHKCGVNKALLHVLSLSTDHSICIWFLCIVFHRARMSLEDTNVLWKEYTAIALQCVRLYFHINLAPIALQLLWRYKSHYYVSYRNTGIYHDLQANFNNFFLPKHSALGK